MRRAARPRARRRGRGTAHARTSSQSAMSRSVSFGRCPCRTLRTGQAPWAASPRRRRSRTTPSASPFFPDAAGTSPCRSGCRGSRRSPCTRIPRRRRAARPGGTAPAASSSACLTSSSVKQLDQLVLGAAAGHRRLEAAEPPVQVEVLDVVEVGLVGAALLGPVGVDVGVRQDPVEPGPQVRALLELAEAPVRLAGRSPARGPRRRQRLRVMRSAAE